MKRTLIVAFLAILGSAFVLAPSYVKAPSPESSNGSAIATTTAEATEDALDVYLSRLAWGYECKGVCQNAVRKGEHFRITDSNGEFSYSCLQFQEATYLAQTEKYGIDPWANGGIYSCDNQLALAKLMFEESPTRAAAHWHTSIYVKGLGLP